MDNIEAEKLYQLLVAKEQTYEDVAVEYTKQKRALEERMESLGELRIQIQNTLEEEVYKLDSFMKGISQEVDEEIPRAFHKEMSLWKQESDDRYYHSCVQLENQLEDLAYDFRQRSYQLEAEIEEVRKEYGQSRL